MRDVSEVCSTSFNYNKGIKIKQTEQMCRIHISIIMLSTIKESMYLPSVFVPLGLRGVLLQGGCPLLCVVGGASDGPTHSWCWVGEQGMLERSAISAMSGKQLIVTKKH